MPIHKQADLSESYALDEAQNSRAVPTVATGVDKEEEGVRKE